MKIIGTHACNWASYVKNIAFARRKVCSWSDKLAYVVANDVIIVSDMHPDNTAPTTTSLNQVIQNDNDFLTVIGAIGDPLTQSVDPSNGMVRPRLQRP
jgi:hypothetical protein